MRSGWGRPLCRVPLEGLPSGKGLTNRYNGSGEHRVAPLTGRVYLRSMEAECVVIALEMISTLSTTRQQVMKSETNWPQ